MRISCRFNNFEEAKAAYSALNNKLLVDKKGDQFGLSVQFLNPEPTYFDRMMTTNFENCLKDKFEGLTALNEVRSDYIKDDLREHIEKTENRVLSDEELFAKNLYKVYE